MIAAAGILLLVLLQVAPQTVDLEDPAIRAAVERFYEMQEKEDVDGYLALWSTGATRPPPAQLKYIFDNGDDKFSDIRITRAIADGDRMRVRVEVRRQRTSPPRVAGDPPVVATSLMRVSITFVKEGDEWKLLREGPAADDLALALVDAGTSEQREMLLASEPELLGLPLLSAMARLGGAASIKQDFKRSLLIYEQIALIARRGGFKKEEGEALQNVANALYFQRRFPEALAAYERRLVVERERGDDAAMASALAGIATIRYSFAEYSEALSRYREALAIHEVLDDVAGIAFASLSIGNITYLQGDFPAAIAAFRRSLELNRTMFNVDGESRALEGLGLVYTAQGDYGAALEVFDAVLRDRRMQNYPGRLGAIAQSLGDVHFRLANLDAAKSSYEESRGHFEKQKDMANVGRVLQSIGLTELVASRFGPAEDLYKRSGSICVTAEDRICSASAIAGLAYAQAAQEKYWEAVASYRKAIDEFAALGRREEGARSEVGLSQALAGAGDFAGAIEAAVSARRTAVALEADDVLWRALTAEARAVRKNGDKERALGVARAAVTVLDRLQTAALDKPGTSLTPDAAAALTTFAVLQAESGDAAGAFATSERLRALDVRAGLATNEREISRGMTVEERAEERASAAQVLTRLAQLTREKGLPRPDAARIASLEKSLADATSSRRDAMQRLFDRLPHLRVWRGLAPPRELADASAVLDSPSVLLLSFVLDDDDLLVLALRKEEAGVAVEAHITPVKRRQVAEQVAALQPPLLADRAAWRKGASSLAALIPAPIVTRMAAASQIIVIPHDVWWRVPFDALPFQDGFLIDHAVVSVAGSLDSLVRSLGVTAAIPDSVVAVGLPDIAPSRTERMKQVAPGWIVRASESVGAEIQAVAGAYDNRATVLAGSTATESGVRTQAANAGAVHIAAPFRINAASPMFSPVLLSALDLAPAEQGAAAPAEPAGRATPSRGDVSDNGSLELREVINLELRARVVVLSDGAAMSMRDGAAAADVVQWGWLAAGVPTLLLSRWAGPAAATERMLAEFHRRVRTGVAPAEALRAARLTVRANTATAAPVYWAGWMLVGAR